MSQWTTPSPNIDAVPLTVWIVSRGRALYVAKSSLCEVIKKVIPESRMISKVSVLSELLDTRFVMKDGWKGYWEKVLIKILVKEEDVLMGCEDFDMDPKVLIGEYRRLF
jgi:hypothetical protein